MLDKSGCNGKWWIFWKAIIPMKTMHWYGRHGTRQFQFRTCERWKRVTVKTKFDKTSPQIIDQNQHLTPCLWVHLMDPFVLRTKNAFCLRLKMWDPQYPLSPLQSSHIVREWMGCPPKRRSYFGSLKPFLSGEPRIPRLNKWWTTFKIWWTTFEFGENPASANAFNSISLERKGSMIIRTTWAVSGILQHMVHISTKWEQKPAICNLQVTYGVQSLGRYVPGVWNARCAPPSYK